MIDYDKLKQAHNLCRPTSLFFDTTFGLDNDLWFVIRDLDNDDWREEIIGVNDLLQKLQELTEPKPKFKVGQWVYILLNCFDIGYGKIDRHDDDYQIKIENGCFKVFEECFIFATKEALIQFQIDYWTCLKNQELSTKSNTINLPISTKLVDEYMPPKATEYGATPEETDKRKILKGSGINLRDAKEIISEYSTPIMQESCQHLNKERLLTPSNKVYSYRCLDCDEQNIRVEHEPCQQEESKPENYEIKYYKYCEHCKKVGNDLEDFRYKCAYNSGSHTVHQTSEQWPYPVYYSFLKQFNINTKITLETIQDQE
jgi:hypothetical protein